MADMQNPNGKMRIIIATSTISMGVNIKGYNLVTTLSDFFWADNIWADIIMGGDIIMGAEKGIETSSNKQQILINN